MTLRVADAVWHRLPIRTVAPWGPSSDRQVRAAARIVPFANLAHAAAIVVTAVMILPIPPVGRVCWALVGVGQCLSTLRWLRPDQLSARRIFIEMIVMTVLFSAAWTTATAWTFQADRPGGELLMVALTAGVLGGGALALSTVRTAGLIWTIAVAAGPIAYFLQADDPVLRQLALLLALYVVAIGVAVLHLSGSFRSRCRAEELALGQRAELQGRLDRLSGLDPVTALPHRQSFGAELERRLGGTQPVTVALVDLDNFRSLNDSLGQAVGDQFLAAVGEVLAGRAAGGEYGARFGGDEFAVILPAGTTRTQALARGAELGAAIERATAPLTGGLLAVTGSIGIADTREVDGDAAGLLRSAELALRVAREAGHGQVRYAGLPLRSGGSVQVHDLAVAVAQHQFEVYWQPQIDLADGAVVGLEALVRWHHPQWGWVEPARFLPLAKESGLMPGIGRLTLDTVLEAAVGWSNGLRLSLNVSAVELLSSGFVDHLLRRVGECGVDPRQIVVEVTEDVMLDDRARQALVELRQAGLGLSMDDFGTGYSSFALLAGMRFDEIKIDRSLIAPLADPDPTFRTLVRTIIDMAAALGARVVAEGVERSDQRDLLRLLGCHSFQGFLEARPAGRPATVQFLRQHADLA